MPKASAIATSVRHTRFPCGDPHALRRTRRSRCVPQECQPVRRQVEGRIVGIHGGGNHIRFHHRGNGMPDTAAGNPSHRASQPPRGQQETGEASCRIARKRWPCSVQCHSGGKTGTATKPAVQAGQERHHIIDAAGIEQHRPFPLAPRSRSARARTHARVEFTVGQDLCFRAAIAEESRGNPVRMHCCPSPQRSDNVRIRSRRVYSSGFGLLPSGPPMAAPVRKPLKPLNDALEQIVAARIDEEMPAVQHLEHETASVCRRHADRPSFDAACPHGPRRRSGHGKGGSRPVAILTAQIEVGPARPAASAPASRRYPAIRARAGKLAQPCHNFGVQPRRLVCGTARFR